MKPARAYLLTSVFAVMMTFPACSGPSKSEKPLPVPAPAEASAPDFVNTVWRVTRSDAVEVGMLYTFQSDGILVISSPHAKPAFGAWRRSGKRLIMVEEGIEYPVDILELTADRFRILISNPGGVSDLTMAPANR
ncbi:MAG: hypothetical protein SGI90_01660 [Candidatus Eisenbacteria bacterium]|nr:hypothetical protein [Candidatus Eisenbacteria bacterium]